MTAPTPRLSLSRRLASALPFLLGWIFVFAQTVPGSAQTIPTGTITGRILNPATGEYVRNAEVRIAGTEYSTVTESDGTYELTDVPVGPAKITVDYTGYETPPATVTVVANQSVNQDFNLSPAIARTGKKDEVVELSTFVVSSEREGNAKAIMDQRRNMNISTSVASDIFGDVTDGNVGEFLKYLPGVDIDYVESETRGPRLGGMDAQYTGVSFDGVRVASADALRTGDLGRATSFEAFSISSIESIEINRTSSPDMDADAPAGTINMKTKRAFDRKGRLLRYNASMNLNSEEFTWSRTYGPGGRKEFKMRPNYSLEYSDSFLRNTLGFVASINHVDSYTEQYRHNLTFNTSPTAADPRPMVITALNFKDGNKNIAKDTYTLTTDWKATRNLVLSNTIIYNYALGQFYNREWTFNAATNNANANTGRHRSLGDVNNVSTNGLATNTSRNSATGGGSASKRTITFTMAQKFELKLASWVIDGAATLSHSFNNYEALEKGHSRSEDTNSITSDFIATRPGNTSHEWVIRQVSGPDWFNLANRTYPRITNEGRYARTEIWTGELNAKWTTPLRKFPTILKFGAKWSDETRKNGNETPYYTWAYVGPGGVQYRADGTLDTTTGSFAAFPNRNTWNTGTTNILTTVNSNGQVLAMPRPDPNALADLARAHPEYFVSNATADNYYNAFIANRRDTAQTVTAGYGMATVRVSPKITMQTGVRWEKTDHDSRDYSPRTSAEMQAAGFTLNSSFRATTIDGLRYQFLTKPQVHHREKYASFFPMVSLKYNVSRSLQFQAGMNKAIARPPTDAIAGVWLINENTQVITAPNAGLKPEYSNNYAARLAYYFEPAGQFSVSVSQNDIRNLRESRTGTAEEFGFAGDPVYGSYSFQSTYNVSSPRRFRNIELAYNQTLPFRAEALRGITINTAVTRSYCDSRRASLLPYRVTGGLGYRYKRLSLRLGVVWRDNTPGMGTDGTYGLYRLHDTKLDVGGEFRLNKWATFFFQGRDIFNGGQTWMMTPPGSVEGQGAAVRVYENYGANWNFGIKGMF
ncbi:MAG: TonB-dependent receptor [Opitutae bacterium]|nr:TonB-dependent receptor [Opitutae bacterium]